MIPANFATRSRGKIIRLTGDEEEFRLTCHCGRWVSMVVGADWSKNFSQRTIDEAEEEVWGQLHELFAMRSNHCVVCPVPGLMEG
jgi:hypothetical protein